MRKFDFRAFIQYGYMEEDFNNPDIAEEIKETGLGIVETPDLIDFREFKPRIMFNTEWYESDMFELMQFTGIYDKSGKPIYEGDIVKITSNDFNFVEICTVIFDEENAKFVLRATNSEIQRDYFNKQNFSNCEIIGNVYENPELLQKVR